MLQLIISLAGKDLLANQLNHNKATIRLNVIGIWLHKRGKGKMVHNSIQLTIFFLMLCSLIHAVLTNIYVSKYAARWTSVERGIHVCIILLYYPVVSKYQLHNAIGPLMLLWCRIFWYFHSHFFPSLSLSFQSYATRVSSFCELRHVCRLFIPIVAMWVIHNMQLQNAKMQQHTLLTVLMPF